MNFDLTATSSGSYRPCCRDSADVSSTISTRIDAKSYSGTVELKDGAVKVDTGSGDSITVPVSGAPPIVIAVDLLKILLDDQHGTPKVPYAGAASYQTD